MNIKVISNEKLTLPFARDAVKEYAKRLGRYCRLKYIESKNNNILKEIDNKAYVITINTQGKLVSSEELAEEFKTLALSGKSDVTFIVAGNESISDDVRDKTDATIAISKLDMNSNVLLVILHEQIYRAFKILNNETYHK